MIANIKGEYKAMLTNGKMIITIEPIIASDENAAADSALFIFNDEHQHIDINKWKETIFKL